MAEKKSTTLLFHSQFPYVTGVPGPRSREKSCSEACVQLVPQSFLRTGLLSNERF